MRRVITKEFILATTQGAGASRRVAPQIVRAIVTAQLNTAQQHLFLLPHLFFFPKESQSRGPRRGWLEILPADASNSLPGWAWAEESLFKRRCGASGAGIEQRELSLLAQAQFGLEVRRPKPQSRLEAPSLVGARLAEPDRLGEAMRSMYVAPWRRPALPQKIPPKISWIEHGTHVHGAFCGCERG